MCGAGSFSAAAVVAPATPSTAAVPTMTQRFFMDEGFMCVPPGFSWHLGRVPADHESAPPA